MLGWKGSDKRTAVRFYVAVVQVVIMFGSEMLVLTTCSEKSLKGFRHRAVRRMAGIGPKRQRGGKWVYPPIGAALVMEGL